MKLFLVSLVGLLMSGAMAQEKYFLASGGTTWVILGSEEARKGYGFHVQLAKPDRRLSFRQSKAKLIQEGYFMNSFGGVQGLQRDTQYNVGFLFMGRYELGLSGTTRAFWEAGWGIQYVNSLSLDIDLKYNSTPTLGVGLLLPDGEGEWIVEARYLHMSNAGMRLPNQGQNWIQLLVGFKF